MVHRGVAIGNEAQSGIFIANSIITLRENVMIKIANSIITLRENVMIKIDPLEN